MSNRVAILLNAPYLDISIDEECIICADGGFNLLPRRIVIMNNPPQSGDY